MCLSELLLRAQVIPVCMCLSELLLHAQVIPVCMCLSELLLGVVAPRSGDTCMYVPQ